MHQRIKLETIALSTLYKSINALKKSKSLFQSYEFIKAVKLLASHRVWTTGMGKCSHIADKLASTLASNNRPAAFIHSGEALHGGLGAIQNGDVLVALSNSGKTDEVIKVIEKVKLKGARVILITSNPNSQIAADCDVVLLIDSVQEACPLGLTPTTSITLMLVICDALAMATQVMTRLTYADYAINHHHGYLGEVARRKGDVNEP